MIDKPKTGDQGKQTEEGISNVTPIVGDLGGAIPETNSQQQKEATSNKTTYTKNIMRPFIALGRLLSDGFLLADKHDGGITALATIAIVILTWFYVGYSKKQWRVMDGQLREMKDTRRPWIGLNGNAQIKGQPIFHIMPTNNQLSVPIAYTTHNFGTSPAFRETNVFTLVPRENSSGPPILEMNRICQSEESLHKDSPGTAIFPAQELNQGLWYPAMIPKTVHYIPQVWFIGCFVYEDSSRQVHHTKYWFVSPPSTDRVPVTGAENELSWAPFSSLVLEHIEAD
jgi:hypothetical protein